MIAITELIRKSYFKITIMVTMCVILTIIFSLALFRFNTSDPEPEVKVLTVEKEREFGLFKSRVFTGLFVQNFPEFDMINNKFVMDGIVWFEYNPDEVMLDVLGKFSFVNGNIISKSTPDVQIKKNRTFVKYTVRVEFKSNLKYYKFPLEDHRIGIVLTNEYLTPYEVIFEVVNTNFTVNPNIFISNWKVHRLNTNRGYTQNILDQVDESKKTEKPIAVFMIDFVKGGIRKAFIIFVPIFLSFLLGLFAFLLTISNIVGRATLAVSSVSTLLGYRFVIERMMPSVGYFTTTDHVYVILLAFAFAMFVFQTLLVRKTMLASELKMSQNEKRDRISLYRLINDITFLIMVMLVVVLVGYVVLL